jgi:hypothetical protein
MESARRSAGTAARLLDGDEVDKVLSGAYYAPAPVASERAKPLSRETEKPTHYRVICISMYTQDLDELDAMVEALKARGLTKASRSALIRYALSVVDLDKVPRGI